MAHKRRHQVNPSPAKLYRWLAVGAVGAGFFGLLVYVLIFKEEIRLTEVEVPLISAPDLPVKRRPDNPGGMDIPNRDKTVYDLLAPEVRTADNSGANPEVTTLGGEETPAIPTAKPEPAKLDAVAEKVTPEPVATPVEPAPQAAPEVAEKAPAPKPTPQPATTSGDWGIQLASFVNTADAKRALESYQKKYSDVASLTPRVQSVNLGNGKGMRYRAQFLGLEDKQAAVALCSKLKKRNQGCLHIKK